jgi:prephenate dehydrogenase
MNTKQITIIGLGQMGTRLAELLVAKGYIVSVWNRTPAKADGIVGVKVFENLEEAIRQSPLVVICVLDYAAVDRILDHYRRAPGGRRTGNNTCRFKCRVCQRRHPGRAGPDGTARNHDYRFR